MPELRRPKKSLPDVKSNMPEKQIIHIGGSDQWIMKKFIMKN